jgi:hypothetical protein
MKPLALRILRMFGQMGKDRLDLHVLFEAAGNEPAERRQVLDAIDELTRAGMLEERGGDFYELTEKGKKAIPAAEEAKDESTSGAK